MDLASKYSTVQVDYFPSPRTPPSPGQLNPDKTVLRDFLGLIG